MTSLLPSSLLRVGCVLRRSLERCGKRERLPLVTPWWQQQQQRTLVEDPPRRPNTQLGRFGVVPFDFLAEADEKERMRSEERTNVLRVHACWSTDDLKDRRDRAFPEDPEEERYEVVRGTVQAVRTKALELYGTAQDLEYYNGREWMPLEDDDQLTPFSQRRGAVLRIRIPKYFAEIQLANDDDDDEGWDEEEEEHYRQYHHQKRQNVAAPSLRKTAPMERLLRCLVQRLRDDGYQRSPVQARTLVDRHRWAVPTQTWILEQAAQNDATLRSMLLTHPGALQHIVTALHQFETLWRP